MLLYLPGNGTHKGFSREFRGNAHLLHIFRVVNTGTVLLWADGVDGAAIRASPAFYPQPGGKSEKIPKNKPVPPQTPPVTPRACFRFFPTKYFPKLLNFF